MLSRSVVEGGVTLLLWRSGAPPPEIFWRKRVICCNVVHSETLLCTSAKYWILSYCRVSGLYTAYQWFWSCIGDKTQRSRPIHQKTIGWTLPFYSKCCRSHLRKSVVSKMWEIWEIFKRCGQNYENVGNVGPLGTLNWCHFMLRGTCLYGPCRAEGLFRWAVSYDGRYWKDRHNIKTLTGCEFRGILCFHESQIWRQNPRFYEKFQYILMWYIEKYNGGILSWNP